MVPRLSDVAGHIHLILPEPTEHAACFRALAAGGDRIVRCLASADDGMGGEAIAAAPSCSFADRVGKEMFLPLPTLFVSGHSQALFGAAHRQQDRIRCLPRGKISLARDPLPGDADQRLRNRPA